MCVHNYVTFAYALLIDIQQGVGPGKKVYFRDTHLKPIL